MKIDITHGVDRVLRHAECYRKIESKEPISEPVAVSTLGVLLALLDEEECRAADWLAECPIDRNLVIEHFPNVVPCKIGENSKNKEIANQFPQRIRFFLDGDEITVGRLEPPMQSAVFFAVQRLHDLLPQQWVFATEHLLYALTLFEDEIGTFLRDRNVTPDTLLEKICRQEGINITEPEILSVTWDDAPEDTLSQDDKSSCNSNLCTKDDQAVVYRILDASANRAMEALRVLEDYVRFGLDDAELTTLTKTMRHELAAALCELPRIERLSARNTTADVGTAIEGTNEYRRISLSDVLAANFSRLQESLRSLEEYGKIIAPPLARTTERLRYESYTLQKVLQHIPSATLQICDVRQRLARASLYVLIDARETEAAFIDRVRAIMQGGTDVIQFRDKYIDDRLRLQRCELLRELTEHSPTLMIVNDRPDIALLCRADGVHVGQEELPLADVRRLVGGEMLIGVSTHSIEQARQAIQDGADYLGAGPVFTSSTKEFEQFPGLDYLKQLMSGFQTSGFRLQESETPEVRSLKPEAIPVFAIGGINLDNVSQVIDAGLRRIAVQSVVTESQAPAATCRQLKELLESTCN